MDGNSAGGESGPVDSGRLSSPDSEEDAAVRLPIEDSLDLHTFSPKEIKPLVEEYLYQCQQQLFREVRIIHGRGTGSQRGMVHSVLATNPCVAAYRDAPPESGGWGATVVTLKKKDL